MIAKKPQTAPKKETAPATAAPDNLSDSLTDPLGGAQMSDPLAFMARFSSMRAQAKAEADVEVDQVNALESGDSAASDVAATGAEETSEGSEVDEGTEGELGAAAEGSQSDAASGATESESADFWTRFREANPINKTAEPAEAPATASKPLSKRQQRQSRRAAAALRQSGRRAARARKAQRRRAAAQRRRQDNIYRRRRRRAARAR